MSSNGTGESKRGAPLFLLLRGVRAAATLEHMFGHCFWADEFHFQGCEGEVDGVASFGVEAALDAVVDQSHETSGDDNTVVVRWEWLDLVARNLLRNIRECLQDALVADPHRAWRHPSTSRIFFTDLQRRTHLGHDMRYNLVAHV
jgi:hypothetical protein